MFASVSGRVVVLVVAAAFAGACGERVPTEAEKAVLAQCAPQRSVKVNGLDLEYELRGPEGAPVLVLIMGLGYQLTHWDTEFVDALVARGFRVLRFDNRDAGLSTKLHSKGLPNQTWSALKMAVGLKPTMAYSLADMAEDTAGLMDALGIQSAHVFGVSLGGMVAQELAIRHPEKVLTLTSAMSTTGEKGLPGPTKEAVAALMLPRPKSHAEAVEHAMKVSAAIGSPGNTLTRDAAEFRVLRTFDRCPYAEGFTRQLAAVMGSESREKRLAAVKVPALVLHGKNDPLVPYQAGEATARAIPGAEWRLIEGMAHDLPRAKWPEIVDAVTTLAAKVSPELAPKAEAVVEPTAAQTVP